MVWGGSLIRPALLPSAFWSGLSRPRHEAGLNYFCHLSEAKDLCISGSLNHNRLVLRHRQLSTLPGIKSTHHIGYILIPRSH
jgi:hypothetical protein